MGCPWHRRGSNKKAVRRVLRVSLGALANRCQLRQFLRDRPRLKDAWGIPALRISMAHGKNEAAMMRDAGARRRNAGSCRRKKYPPHHGSRNAGMAIHEVGISRMGDDPKKSVPTLLPVARCRNLLVADGSGFVSRVPESTLTMMAISVRACDHLIERFRPTTSKDRNQYASHLNERHPHRRQFLGAGAVVVRVWPGPSRYCCTQQICPRLHQVFPV